MATDAAPEARPSVEASSYQRFEIGFEVGPLGIAEGGMLFLSPEPFWEWSGAQTGDPEAPGYTTARIRPTQARGDAPGLASDGGGTHAVELVPSGFEAAFRVSGGDLEAGRRIDFVYGAGAARARVDLYAERGAEIMIGVDADGDGFREWLDEGVPVDVHAGPGVRLVAFGPAEIAPNQVFELTTSILDRIGNRARWPDATRDASGQSLGRFAVRVLDASSLGLASPPPLLESSGPFEEAKRLSLRPAAGEGTIRLRLEGRDALEGLAFELPPIVVRDAPRRLVWGDLHGHSRASDGTGTTRDYFRYARDVAGLDVIALTDHDHWGPRPLDEDRDRAREILETVREFHAPGRFVTIPGYEWTSWLYGHRHVLYFEEDSEGHFEGDVEGDVEGDAEADAAGDLDDVAPIYSSLDPATDRPDELWNVLRGRRALTFAHHSAGEPVATDWHYRPDPVLEPLTEIASVHGNSEALDAPSVIRGGIPGNFVRDVLMRGDRLGFIGSGDSHDGHPGLAQIASGQAGLAGVFTTALDRASLLEAMRARRTFATNGIRPWLEVEIDGAAMGGTLAARDGSAVLRVRYEATAPIERVDLIRSGRIAPLTAPEAEPFGLSLRLERTIPALGAGEFHYVRILQTDGGLAWSSPIFASDPTSVP